MENHPGVLNMEKHPEAPANAFEIAHMKNFPITDDQAQAAAKRGETVYDASGGQVVEFSHGVRVVHGSQDGLHVADDEIFK